MCGIRTLASKHCGIVEEQGGCRGGSAVCREGGVQASEVSLEDKHKDLCCVLKSKHSYSICSF